MKTIGVVPTLALLLGLGCNSCTPQPVKVDAGGLLPDAGPTLQPLTIANDVDLPVELIPQTTSMWCWAASGEMTMKFLGRDITQCDQGNYATSNTNCCVAEQCPNPNEQSTCVQGGWPDYQHWQFDAEQTEDQALSWAELTGELLAKRPVAFSWRYEGGGGHMMVAHGFLTVNGENKVRVLNPWPPCEGTTIVIAYDDFVARAGEYTHWNDFYDIQNNGPQAVTVSPISAPLTATVLPMPIHATPAPHVSPTIKLVKEAAAAAVAKLGPTSPRELGLPLKTDPARVSLGTPIKMGMVRLDELRAFTAQTNPNALVHDTGSYLVPVLLDGKPVSAVILTRTAAGFRTVGAGYAPLARGVSDAVGKLPGIPDRQLRVIQIPALHVDFLGYRQANTLKLRPIPPANSPKLLQQILMGNSDQSLPEEFTASDAFLRLVKRAKAQPTKFPG
jgi:hypothetical protein